MIVPSARSFVRTSLGALALVPALLLGGCQSSDPAPPPVVEVAPQTVGVLFINDCEIYIRPPVASGSYVEVGLARNGSGGVRATVEPSGDDLAVMRDFAGNAFQSGGTPITGAIDPSLTTYLDFAYANAQIQVTGEINDQTIDTWTMPANGTPSNTVIERIGEDNAGSTASRVRFYLRGFRTGFQLLDD